MVYVQYQLIVVKEEFVQQVEFVHVFLVGVLVVTINAVFKKLVMGMEIVKVLMEIVIVIQDIVQTVNVQHVLIVSQDQIVTLEQVIQHAVVVMEYA